MVENNLNKTIKNTQKFKRLKSCDKIQFNKKPTIWKMTGDVK
jgi:hypothetical protein